MGEFMHSQEMLAANQRGNYRGATLLAAGLSLLLQHGSDAADMLTGRDYDPPAAVAAQTAPVIPAAPAEGHCRPDTATAADIGLQVQAQFCLEQRQGGRIAMVGYGLDLTVLEQVEGPLERSIARTTGGSIVMDVVPLAASRSAVAEQAAANGPVNCINDHNNGNTLADPAIAADATMPELQDYDLVLAVTKAPSCKPRGGVAQLAKGRHMTTYANAMDQAPDIGRIGKTSLHEFLHQQGLGHFGTFIGDINGDGDYRHLELEEDQDDVVVNLGTYLRNGEYVEYAVTSDNPMGGGLDDPESARLSPLQTEALDWPDQALGRDRDYLETRLDENGAEVVLTGPSAEEGRFVTMPLAEPVAYRDPAYTGEQGESGHNITFDRLVVLPDYMYTHDMSGVEVRGANLLLTNSANDFVSFATVDPELWGTERRTYHFQDGDQVLTLTMTADTLSVSRAPAVADRRVR